MFPKTCLYNLRYKQLVDDYSLLLNRIKDRGSDIRKLKIFAREEEDLARKLLERYEDFGYDGIELVVFEVKAKIEGNSGRSQRRCAKALFREMYSSGLMVSGKFWSDWLSWYKIESRIFIPDEKKLGPGANTFTLAGYVEELRDWRGYFAREVSSWWKPENMLNDDYKYYGILNQYIDHKFLKPYHDQESFANEFKDTATYAEFISKIRKPISDKNPLGNRSGVEYAAITLYLVNSKKVCNLRTYRDWQSHLCRTFAIPDYSNYFPGNIEVQTAYSSLQKEFRFLL
jgi:hypothetical protein